MPEMPVLALDPADRRPAISGRAAPSGNARRQKATAFHARTSSKLQSSALPRAHPRRLEPDIRTRLTLPPIGPCWNPTLSMVGPGRWGAHPKMDFDVPAIHYPSNRSRRAVSQYRRDDIPPQQGLTFRTICPAPNGALRSIGHRRIPAAVLVTAALVAERAASPFTGRALRLALEAEGLSHGPQKFSIFLTTPGGVRAGPVLPASTQPGSFDLRDYGHAAGYGGLGAVQRDE